MGSIRNRVANDVFLMHYLAATSETPTQGIHLPLLRVFRCPLIHNKSPEERCPIKAFMTNLVVNLR